MEFRNAAFVDAAHTTVSVEADGVPVAVACDPANRMYASMLAQTIAIDEYVAPAPPVPETVALWQARAALRQAGLFDRADATINASGNLAVIEAWNNGNEVARKSPTVSAMASALQLTETQIDDLFTRAAALTV